MKQLLTPRDLATAIGASESSLRRWIDAGVIPVSRTVGGHRRIPLAKAVQFIRQTKATILRPELLGLRELSAVPALPPTDQTDADQLFDALQWGDAALARGLVLNWYLEGRPTAEIFDGPMRQSMQRMGELWRHDRQGILTEHRAVDIVLTGLNQLRLLVGRGEPAHRGQNPDDAPVAVGGAPAGDPYLLPTLMASIVLAEAGYHTVNYGPDVPIELLGKAAAKHDARLVWLSASVAATPANLAAARKLRDDLASRKVRVVLGGREVGNYAKAFGPNAQVAGSMVELLAMARKTLPAAPNAPTIGMP